jgi:hypothetical protein
MSDIADHDDDEEADSLVYAYKPSLMGSVWEVTLKRDGLGWQLGAHKGLIPYDRIRRVRLSYRPVTMQSHRFVTEVWSDAAPKISIASASWRTIMEMARQDAAYTSFVTELHRRLAAAGSTASFTHGMPAVIYGFGLVVFLAATLAFAALTVRALQLREWAAVAVVGGFFVLFAWQIGVYFRRNRPGRYRPDALPADALPRGQRYPAG